MRLAWALELTHNFLSTPNSLEGLDSLLDPSLVEQFMEQAGVANLRKRRLPPTSKCAVRAHHVSGTGVVWLAPCVQIVLNTPHVAVLLHQRGQLRHQLPCARLRFRVGIDACTE